MPVPTPTPDPTPDYSPEAILKTIKGLKDGESADVGGWVLKREGNGLSITPPKPGVQEGVIEDFGPPGAAYGLGMAIQARGVEKEMRSYTEKLHPRDRTGKWRDVLGGLKNHGDSVTHEGVTVTKVKTRAGHEFRVNDPSSREERQLRKGQAVKDAVERTVVYDEAAKKALRDAKTRGSATVEGTKIHRRKNKIMLKHADGMVTTHNRPEEALAAMRTHRVGPGRSDPGIGKARAEGLRARFRSAKAHGYALMLPALYEGVEKGDQALPGGTAHGDIGSEILGIKMEEVAHQLSEVLMFSAQHLSHAAPDPLSFSPATTLERWKVRLEEAREEKLGAYAAGDSLGFLRARAQEEALTRLIEAGVPHFEPPLHPRDRHGRFRDLLRAQRSASLLNQDSDPRDVIDMGIKQRRDGTFHVGNFNVVPEGTTWVVKPVVPHEPRAPFPG